MNGKPVMMLTLTVVMLTFGSETFPQDNVESLRGKKAIGETSDAPELKPWQTGQGPVPRDFAQQPPLIPHPIDGYQFNLEFNACLTCHSPENSSASGATGISQSHFKNRDGEVQEKVSASRYSCTQCHVEQREAEPLIENEFKTGVD